MRKVTASAVILTALTGCSQSGGIPSTQWSYEVPSGDEVAETRKESRADVDKASLVQNSLDGSQILADARSAMGRSTRSANSRIMGPAFEQPEADGLISPNLISSKGGAKVSAATAQESSGLSSRTYGLTSGLGSTRASTRPDPVAQVRAYLRSNSPSASPSALTNREPYSSQVYLSSLPLPNQSYAPSGSAIDRAIGGESGLGSSFSGENFSEATLTSVAAPIGLSITDSSVGSTLDSTFMGRESAPNYSALGLPAVDAVGVDAAATATTVDARRFDESSFVDDNGLPQLAASVPSTYESAVVVDASSEDVSLQPLQSSGVTSEELPAEDISIGTAILNSLEHSSDLEIAADEAVPAPATTASTVTAPSAEPYAYSETSYSGYSSSSVSSSVAYAPATPSVASLTQTMPKREISPLVASYRADRNMPVLDDSGDLSTPSRIESGAPASIVPASVQGPSHSFNVPSSSPLLESLESDEGLESSSQLTIYVPIAETMPSNASATLVKDAVNKLSAEVSTSEFIDEIAQEAVFSSVLSSAALLSSQSAKAVLPLAESSEPVTADENVSGITTFDVFDKLSAADSAMRRAKARRAQLTLATSRQEMSRRQRLTWL